MFQKKICRRNRNEHFKFNTIFFENFVFYEITWKNVVELRRPQYKKAQTLGMLDNKGYRRTLRICKVQ